MGSFSTETGEKLTRLGFAVVLALLVTGASVATEIRAPRTTLPADYYQVIITNNLFRPLGWTKPKPKPAFELIATVMRRNGVHKALLRSVKERKDLLCRGRGTGGSGGCGKRRTP